MLAAHAYNNSNESLANRTKQVENRVPVIKDKAEELDKSGKDKKWNMQHLLTPSKAQTYKSWVYKNKKRYTLMALP